MALEDQVPPWTDEDETNLRRRVEAVKPHPSDPSSLMRFDGSYRKVLLRSEAAREYRKRARVLAVQIVAPFIVETERGWMHGAAGDYLITNHPDDDESSDIWPVSRERFERTYERSASGGLVDPP